LADEHGSLGLSEVKAGALDDDDDAAKDKDDWADGTDGADMKSHAACFPIADRIEA
jgi:hypothetical protein